MRSAPMAERQAMQGFVRRSLTEDDPPLPPRDQVLLSPGQVAGTGGRRGQQLHENALGIYGAPRPPPVGDEVLPSAPPQAPPGLVPPEWAGQPYAPYGGMPQVGRQDDMRRFNEMKRGFRDDTLEYPEGVQARLIGMRSAPISDDPLDYSGRYNTQLAPDQEQQYLQWLQLQSALNKRDMSRDTYDYDLRGAFAGGAAQDPGNAHYPDTFKKPNHPSFSTGSQYHGVDGHIGGAWVQNQGVWSFTPGPTNLQLHGPQGLQNYFQRVEPNTQLIMPPQPVPTMQDHVRQQLGQPME